MLMQIWCDASGRAANGAVIVTRPISPPDPRTPRLGGARQSGGWWGGAATGPWPTPIRPRSSSGGRPDLDGTIGHWLAGRGGASASAHDPAGRRTTVDPHNHLGTPHYYRRVPSDPDSPGPERWSGPYCSLACLAAAEVVEPTDPCQVAVTRPILDEHSMLLCCAHCGVEIY